MSHYLDALRRLRHDLESAGHQREFLEVVRVAGSFPTARSNRDGTPAEISVWCSNDYLGMGQHPGVLAAMRDAITASGAGAGGSRNIAGTNTWHSELERELAELHGKDDALLFASGYTANEGALSVLAGRIEGCLVFSDEKNHASIIDGLRHSGAEKRIFRHNDPDHLEELVAAEDPARPKMIVTESVYSMDGDIAPLARIADIADRYGAVTFLDEVHAVGMYGPQGAGIAASLGLADAFTVVMGTLAKGFGTTGGYIAGPADVIDVVRGLARSFIFTTALPPAVVAGGLAAVRHLRRSDAERVRLRENATLMHRLLRERRIPFLSDESHIVSVLVGEDATCRRISDLLLARHGIYVQSINAPSVPVGREILRVAPGAVHSTDGVRGFVDALDAIWGELAQSRSPTSRVTVSTS
ncbi:5-aminolevulinate synthase [Micromonospora sp. WMMD882]|uniref:5-aminolevulinate synthase n=1 Tax=Micromonospora sp. WMMD882 TaxID=3015151 RepID=UPI00248AAEE3|nr:5-aminolevulinate synthase [Micromonospora sp. WMMD882]WBB80361.1 5-aminolevulinate synthase [Micromonospora sp. WMMD882]